MDGPTLDTEKQSVPDAPKASSSKGGFPLLPVIIVAIVFVALVIMGGLPRFLNHERLEQKTKKQLSETMSVTATEAQPGKAIEEFTLPGATEAIQDAPIYARVNGYLHKRYVNIGDHVHAGQILADIEVPEIDQQVAAAQSAVTQAEAGLDNSKEALVRAEAAAVTASANVRKGRTDLQFYTAEVGRYTQLATEGAVSMETRDSHIQDYHGGRAVLDSLYGAERGAQAAVKSAKAAVAQAEAALMVAKANLSQVEATRSFKNVTALFDGVVTKRNVDAGALISSGSNNANGVLFEIAKTDILRVFVYVPEQYVPYIHEKEQAFLEFQEYPNRRFVGIVTNVSGGLDPASKTLQVEIHVPNDSHVLMPGMYAKVHFQAPTKERLALVPATVLLTRPDGSYVFVVDKADRIHLNKLDIGRDLGGQFEIQKGVKPGDLVIVNPPDDLRDGMLVKPVIIKPAKDSSS